MKNIERLQQITQCLDNYMAKVGKNEINDMEANRELARAGVLNDECVNPGEPLRRLLEALRDTNKLPENIRMIYGSWRIKLSGMVAKGPKVDQFQYA